MLKLFNCSCINKIISGRRFFIQAIFFAATFSVLVSCAETVWKNYGDSCIQISENPPLRRVINYSDHALCGRKLSPRDAPNPQIRPQNEKN